MKKEGIRGCFSYWKGTLSEEASDVTLYLNEKAGWYYMAMHRCPSKGRLLKLRDEIGVEPYHRYCLHCDHYRAAIEKVGLTYTYNFTGVDQASCSLLITICLLRLKRTVLRPLRQRSLIHIKKKRLKTPS